MANAEARTTPALLFSFSAALLLLLARRDAIADLLLPALDRFHLDARTLLDLATRRNMILLCHAILLLILRDAGILGAPARRRAATATTASAIVGPAPDAEAVFPAPTRPRATTTSVVVWRRPRSSAKDAAGADESGRRHARRRQPRRNPQRQPALTLEPHLLVSKEIVLLEKATTTRDLDEQAAPSATDDGNKSDSDRRINAAAGEEAPELADDRMFDEFIVRQRSKMWQDSLQLVVRVPASGDTNMLA